MSQRSYLEESHVAIDEMLSFTFSYNSAILYFSFSYFVLNHVF